MATKQKRQYVITKQPINDCIDALATSIESEFHVNPMTNAGLTEVMSNTAATESYMDGLLTHVNDEGEKALITGAIMKTVRTYESALANEMQAAEGYTHTTDMAGNVGIGDFATPATIVGYHARAHMLDFYKAINLGADDDAFEIEFYIDFAISSAAEDKSERKILPASFRDGSLDGMYDTDKVNVAPSAGTKPYITDVDGVGYIKLGSIGNAIKESGDRNINDWSLGEKIRIDSIRYDARVDMLTGAPIVKTMIIAADSSVAAFGGRATTLRTVDAQVQLPLYTDDTTKDGANVYDFFSAHIDRSTGEYRSNPSSTGRILDYTWSVAFHNNTNLADTIEHGSDSKTARVVPEPRPTMSLGFGLDGAMKSFRRSADIVKFVSNEFSTMLTFFNDLSMEGDLFNDINAAIANPAHLDTKIGAEKLGGWCEKLEIDTTLGGRGGDKPYDWVEFGVKETLTNALISAETATEFSDASDREWVMIGYELDVRRFADTKYFTENGNNVAAGSNTKFGFKKESSYAYTDTFNRRVKLIGSTDVRFKNRGGAVGQVFGFMRSNTPDVQPTGIYIGESFKVMKTRHPKQTGIDSISFWVHDTWDILALCGVRVDMNNPMDSFAQTVNNSKLVVTQ